MVSEGGLGQNDAGKRLAATTMMGYFTGHLVQNLHNDGAEEFVAGHLPAVQVDSRHIGKLTAAVRDVMMKSDLIVLVVLG